MRDRCWIIALVMVLIVLPSFACAEEFAGKLERVDRDSITVLGGNDQRLVVRVDGSKRLQAAPFLGKSVTVYLSNERGECRALGLKGRPQTELLRILQANTHERYLPRTAPCTTTCRLN